MKLIIAGSRTIKIGTNFILQVFNDLALPNIMPIKEIVSGGAKGVDKAGEAFALEMGLKLTQLLPDYDIYPTQAPLIRNSKMAAYADALLLIWDGSSRGSADMKKKMQKLNKPVYEVLVKKV